MVTRLAFGLRARIVAALVLTSAVTLGVAALALLPALDAQLRQEEQDSLESTTLALAAAFQRLTPGASRPGSRELKALVRTVARRTEGEVAVLRSDGTVAASDRLAAASAAAAPRARRALATGRLMVGSTSTSLGEQAEVALPVRIGGERGVLLVRRRLTEAGEAAALVRRGFVVAALIGLLVAIVLGFVLATGLVRRLRALRDTAQRVAEIGPAAEIEAETARDEVGDLTRTLAATQRKLHAQEEARRRFVATASHELRTPLTSMQLALESLEEDLAAGTIDPGEVAGQVGRARAQTGRLTRLSADLLDLSRIDAITALRSEPLDLARLATAVTSEFAARADGQTVRMEVSDQGECWATVDPGSSARIIRILLDNALKFAPGGSTVSIATRSEPDRSLVAVSDAGPGVTDADAELIFERFHRGETTGEQVGFGLGLAIGRELARRMGGELSLAPGGKGATFVLELPLTRR